MFDLHGDREEVLETVKAYGPVQLDAEAYTYIGCLVRSNNTAELSAVPHAVAHVLKWRRTEGRRQHGLRIAHEVRYGGDVLLSRQVPCCLPLGGSVGFKASGLVLS